MPVGPVHPTGLWIQLILQVSILLVGLIGWMVGLVLYAMDRADLVQTILLPAYTAGVILCLTFRSLYLPTLASPELLWNLWQKGKATPEEPLAIPLPSPTEPGTFSMTGSFKLMENENFEAFLAAQGVPYMLRSAANRARPIHKITHINNVITIQIKGLIESQTTYEIGGPPVRGLVRGRLFEDKVTYLYLDDLNHPGRIEALDIGQQKKNGTTSKKTITAGHDQTPKEQDQTPIGIQVRKHAVDDGYTIFVQRRLSDDRQTITLTSRCEFDDHEQETVHSKQIFQRIVE